MNYEKIYSQMVERAKSRILVGYQEKHHIIPKCMGGNNESENIVALTAEEHYLVHLLLVRIYPDNIKLVYAANRMACNNRKKYSIARKWYSNTTRGLKKSGPHKKAISEAKKQNIEFCGQWYRGWDELKTKTGVTRHLYLKYGDRPELLMMVGKRSIWQKPKGIDEQMKRNISETRRKTALGRTWYNNGEKEFFLRSNPKNLQKGRLK